ncbi:hypothetical protein D1007_06027 [Hordeum vulgare]|nr:hypothetical protein D1007_06027 [Hordeum vulgare]
MITIVEYPWDGSTSWIFIIYYFIYALFVVSLTRPTVACLLLLLISPLCGVTETPDCGMLVITSYLPFMWCRLNARLRDVIINISPLCGVAQTPDYDMLVIILLKPYMWCRSDARRKHVLYHIL